MEEKKNKNILIIFLCFIICLLLGYIIYDKVIEKESNVKQEDLVKESKPEEQKESVEKKLQEEDIKEYLEDYHKVIVHFGNELPLKSEEIDNQNLLMFASRNVKREGMNFQASDLRNVIEKVFGKDYKYQLEDINCFVKNDGVLFKYNSTKDEYEFYGEHGHGGMSSIRHKIYFIDATEKDDTIIINTKILYGSYCGDTCGPATNFYKKPIYNKEYMIYEVSENEVEEDNYDYVYSKYKDQLPITKFILKRQSDNKFGLSEIIVE